MGNDTIYVVKSMILAPHAWRVGHPNDIWCFVTNQVITNLDQLVERRCANNRDEAAEVLRGWVKGGIVVVASESTYQFARAQAPAKAPAELGISVEDTMDKKAPYGPSDPHRSQRDLMAHNNDPSKELGYDPAMLRGKSVEEMRELLRDAMPGIEGTEHMDRNELMDVLSFEHKSGAGNGMDFTPPLGENVTPKT